MERIGTNGVRTLERGNDTPMKTRIIDPLAPDKAGGQAARDPVRIILGSDESDGRISLVEVVGRRGSVPPLRRHQHEDLLVYIVDGRLTWHIDGQQFLATSGSCILLPRGSEHGYTIQSETAHLLILLTPAGSEAGLVELFGSAHGMSPTAAEGSCEAIERMVTIAARYGVDITGPPPGAA